MLQRPDADEVSSYLTNYTSLVPDGDVRDHLRRQQHETIVLLSGVDEARAARGYAPGKWTLKESLLHVIDTERVFAHRLLRIARGDATPLPAFDQDAWVPNSAAAGRSVASLLLEYAAVRAATVQLVESLEPAAWGRRGTASGVTISARALAYVITGHELHHHRIFRERYLA
ncbi:MAG: DinB family protein [Gemmatimonadota bacterium]|nr:DinB family protein [Gemmatimonadota bacterium]